MPSNVLLDLLEYPVQTAHDEREKYAKLYRLTTAFVQAARPIAEQLILDSFLPPARKLFKYVPFILSVRCPC